MPLIEYFHGDGRTSDERPTFPRSVFADHDDPAGYFATAAVRAAVNVALNLGMPLLLTGEPGTGKSVLAKAVARELKLPLIEFVAKSTTTATDLLYRFDAVRHFRDSQVQALSFHAAHHDGSGTEPEPAPMPPDDKRDLSPYIRFEALGRAIALTYPPDDPVLGSVWNNDANQIPGETHLERGARSVVLIDEIDKAPRDVPNDLLAEIDRGTFRIAETGTQLTVQKDLRPIVILASNSEKSLPDAFMRRCVFHHIDFPKADDLACIVARRLPELLGPDGQAKIAQKDQQDRREQFVITDLTPLARDGLSLLEWLRPDTQGRYDPLRKPPSVAEFLAWLRLLLRSGLEPQNSLDATLRAPDPWFKTALGVLLKDRADFARVIDGDLALANWRRPAS